MTAKKKPPPPAATGRPTGIRRDEIRFLVLFVALLAGSFTILSLTWVNDHVVEPFTGAVAWASAGALDLLGQEVKLEGTGIRNARFAVNIRNGCNGVETMVIFLSAVLAFPATWSLRAKGLLLGVLAIQAINLVRVVALFLTGAYYPAFFDSSHTVVWQSIVIACGVGLWILWASRVGPRPAAAAPAPSPTAGEGG